MAWVIGFALVAIGAVAVAGPWALLIVFGITYLCLVAWDAQIGKRRAQEFMREQRMRDDLKALFMRERSR